MASLEVVLVSVSGWVLLYDRRCYQARRKVLVLAQHRRLVLESGLEVVVLVLDLCPTRVLSVRGLEVELWVEVFAVVLVAVVVVLSLSPSLWEQRWVVLVGGGPRRY